MSRSTLFCLSIIFSYFIIGAFRARSFSPIADIASRLLLPFGIEYHVEVAKGPNFISISETGSGYITSTWGRPAYLHDADLENDHEPTALTTASCYSPIILLFHLSAICAESVSTVTSSGVARVR